MSRALERGRPAHQMHLYLWRTAAVISQQQCVTEYLYSLLAIKKIGNLKYWHVIRNGHQA